MNFDLRPYQSGALNDLWSWFGRHKDGNPIVEAAVGAGKSVMIAALAKRVHAEVPGTRVLVLMHQRELLDQNLAKLKAIWPEADAGVVSASHGKRQITSQIIFATIGSIYKIAHLLGHIGIVLADECHMIQTKETGMWRKFLKDLFTLCPTTRIIGWTGTPFRGDGVWLTAGESPLFTHIAAKVSMKSLLDSGYLSPLMTTRTTTRIDASDVRLSGGDYVLSDLAKVTDRDDLVQATCDEIVSIAHDRKRWLVFAVTVQHAENVTAALRKRGINAGMVTGNTPKAEREQTIAAFRCGELRCLVNVAVLTTGFDAPGVDFIALLRATKSPVLYVQIMGRGMRLADKKTDCLVADFTDTIETLGPVDAIKGRLPKVSSGGSAPFKLCPECGSRNAAGAAECIDCGHEFPLPEKIKHGISASNAAILSAQVAPKIITYPVTDVMYSEHTGRDGKPNSLRVDYISGLRRVASEWVCFEHSGFARAKAEQWCRRTNPEGFTHTPGTVAQYMEWLDGGFTPQRPTAIVVNETGKFPEIVKHLWEPLPDEPARTDRDQASPALAIASI